MSSDHQLHDHQQCIRDAITRAEKICAERSLRLTDLRKRVLELIWNSHRPVGAYALLDELKPDHPAAAPPTIYRALDFLQEHGLVHRIQSLNAFVGCDDPEHNHRGFFLICNDCGNAVEIEDRIIDKTVDETAANYGFEVQSRTLEATGLCQQCRAA